MKEMLEKAFLFSVAYCENREDYFEVRGGKRSKFALSPPVSKHA